MWKRRSISFYLNAGFTFVLACLLTFVAVAGSSLLHRIAVQNTIDRMEVALNYAEELLINRNSIMRASLEEAVQSGSVDELIINRDREGLDSLLAGIEATGSSSAYSLVVNAHGTILASRQEAVGQIWGLSYLLDPLRDGSTTITTTEVLPSRYVLRCSRAFQDRVYVPTYAGTTEDITYACLSLVVVPVRNDDGELVGALVGGHAINNDREFAEAYTARVPNTYLSAAANDGIRLCSNIAVGDFSFPEGTMQSEEFVQQLAAGGEWRGVELMEDGREGVVAANPVRNYRGEVIGNLGVGAPVFTIPELSGAVVTAFVLVLMAIFLAAAAVMRLLTNIVVRPLSQLRDISTAIATDKALPEGSVINGLVVPSEIEDLASDIFTMAATITGENSELENRVYERTVQLDNTITELERANRHKSQFLANISHELRTPLNSIIGFASLLKDRVAGPMNATQERYTDVIIESGNHLLDMINDILKLVKIDTGADKASPAPVNLPLLVSDTANSVYPLFNNRKQALVISIEDEENVPIVFWDEKKIRQVILNLLVNAGKFTPEKGSVTICVALSEDDTIQLDVIDTGIGIKDEMKERVFLAFEQADNSYTREYQGVGLGLAITKSIVEMHHGSVWLEDNPGGGTQVRMNIPVDPFGGLGEHDDLTVGPRGGKS